MQKHLKDQNKVLPCMYCDFKSNNENVFLNHITSVHGAGFTCLTCNTAFRTNSELISHVVDAHKMKEPVKEKCVSCGEQFKMIEHLTEHILRHHTMLTSKGQSNLVGQQFVRLWPNQEQQRNQNQEQRRNQNQEQLRNQNNKNCYDCGDMFSNHEQLMGHKKEKHYKEKLCNYYHKQGSCRYGDQCFNIHEINQQMNQSHEQRLQFRQNQSNIECRNGPNCEFKSQNRCRYNHSVTNVTNNSRGNQSNMNTSVFNMKELLVSLGARLERIEQNVPNLMSMQDFPSVQEGGSKQKTY